jgi:hypothetical protein
MMETKGKQKDDKSNTKQRSYVELNVGKNQRDAALIAPIGDGKGK